MSAEEEEEEQDLRQEDEHVADPREPPSTSRSA